MKMYYVMLLLSSLSLFAGVCLATDPHLFRSTAATVSHDHEDENIVTLSLAKADEEAELETTKTMTSSTGARAETDASGSTKQKKHPSHRAKGVSWPTPKKMTGKIEEGKRISIGSSNLVAEQT
jgi:hypothetical protein